MTKLAINFNYVEPFNRPPLVATGAARETTEGRKRLVGTTLYGGSWEVLIYEGEDHWEACVFNHELHHEHVTAASLEAVKRRAKRLIDLQESPGRTNVSAPVSKQRH